MQEKDLFEVSEQGLKQNIDQLASIVSQREEVIESLSVTKDENGKKISELESKVVKFMAFIMFCSF